LIPDLHNLSGLSCAGGK